DNRKRKHAWNNHTKVKSVEAGLSGLFFTCDGREQQALNEAYNLIDQMMEELGDSSTAAAAADEKVEGVVGQKKEESDEDPDEDIADTIKRQCNEQKEAAKDKKKRRCHQRPTGVKNCLFVTVKDADILALCERMLTSAQAAPICRYLQRVLPVEETANAGLKEMNELVLKLVQRHLVKDADGKLPTYALEYKTRNNDSIKRGQILEMLNDAVSMVAPTAKVDLTDPDITLYVQVVRKSILGGVTRKFNSRRKYSMRPSQEEKEEVKDKKKEEEEEDKNEEEANEVTE
ncbi:hypothetical protein PFISCL1PPCAC_365, partial [Pristionchus fissidentatus]